VTRPFEQLLSPRVQHTAHLFATTNDTVESIAETVGYANPFVISNSSLRVVGVCLSQFWRLGSGGGDR
jgi:transcriptional regulator GlxA family with amidase domain